MALVGAPCSKEDYRLGVVCPLTEAFVPSKRSFSHTPCNSRRLDDGFATLFLVAFSAVKEKNDVHSRCRHPCAGRLLSIAPVPWDFARCERYPR